MDRSTTVLLTGASNANSLVHVSAMTVQARMRTSKGQAMLTPDVLKNHLTVTEEDHRAISDLSVWMTNSGWQPIFVGEPHDRLGWGNHPYEEKWPSSDASRRVVLSTHNIVIVRGPSRYIHDDGRIHGWRVVGSAEAYTFQDFVSFLSLPQVGVLPEAYSPAYISVVEAFKTRCPCNAWDITMNPHTKEEHKSCGSNLFGDGYCGGCDTCMSMQIDYYKMLEREKS